MKSCLRRLPDLIRRHRTDMSYGAIAGATALILVLALLILGDDLSAFPEGGNS